MGGGRARGQRLSRPHLGSPAKHRGFRQGCADTKLHRYSGHPTRDRWTFNRQGQEITLYLNATLLTNSVHLLCEYAMEHAGIVCVSTLVAAQTMQQGRLQHVLPEHLLQSFWLSAVYAVTSRNAFKLRLFIKHISAQFKRIPPGTHN